ncbi:alpha/beta hydrolase [Priestia flexa]|uniref:alpha/beta hydrolase n=1 Tax=Priestia flexa TaxID=86664 RepID=UPI003F83131C
MNTTERKEVVIVGAEQKQVKSRFEAKEYQIFVSKPSSEPPENGYPIIYVLDANSIFGTVVEAMRLQSGRSEKTGVVPAIIVGIGYPVDTPFSVERYYDFTFPSTNEELPISPSGRAWPKHGGAENFLRFIEEDLKPIMHRDFHVDQNKQTIFGHSLGGLFVLSTLLVKPHTFQTYIAGSPSIHWNKRLFSQLEEQFQEKARKEKINVNVLIGVGELEKHHKSGMNDNAFQCSNRFKKYGLHVEFKEFEDEGHLSVLLPLVNKAIRFSSVV